MAESLEPKFISRDHNAAFGRIVQAFVTAQVVYQHVLEKTFRLDTAVAALMFSAYGYDQTKNLLKATISESGLPESERKLGISLIDKVNDKAALRNNIAHCSWKPGQKPGTLRPMVMKTRGSVFILGIEHNEKEWAADELHAEADEILARVLRVAQFFTDRGLDIGTDDAGK